MCLVCLPIRLDGRSMIQIEFDNDRGVDSCGGLVRQAWLRRNESAPHVQAAAATHSSQTPFSLPYSFPSTAIGNDNETERSMMRSQPFNRV